MTCDHEEPRATCGERSRAVGPRSFMQVCMQELYSLFWIDCKGKLPVTEKTGEEAPVLPLCGIW